MITPWLRIGKSDRAHLFEAGRSLCGLWALHFPSKPEAMKTKRCQGCETAQRERTTNTPRRPDARP